MDNMEEEFDLAKWLAGEMSSSELEAFEKSPHYATYAKIKKHASELRAPELGEAKLYDKIIGNRTTGTKIIRLYQKWISIAAALIVLLGLAYIFKPDPAKDVYAGNGKQTSFTLPDHSEVVLNAGSKIHYNEENWNNHRKLNLEGEAFFHVAKGKKFEVRTSLGKVTVLGTQFNVKSRGKRFEINCYEGRVRVNYNNTQQIITKGQAIAFENGNRIDIEGALNPEPEWLRNKLSFNRENLQHIVEELNRQYSTPISIKGAIKEQLFTGTIPMRNLDEALQILTSVYHLKIVKTDTEIILENG